MRPEGAVDNSGERTELLAQYQARCDCGAGHDGAWTATVTYRTNAWGQRTHDIFRHSVRCPDEQ